MKLSTHGRYGYSPIVARPDFSWPEGKRLAVYVGLNLEHFAFGEGLGAELAPGGPQPDVLNYAWRDWGNRVGAWRMLDLFEGFDLPVTVLANSAMYEYAPALLAAFRDRGDEIAGHGRTNSERQSTLPEAEERALIAEATRRIAAAEGAAPEGWLSPWIAESPVTPDLLSEAGYRYTLNWCMDDQPVWMRTRSGRILSIPYPQELNDIPAIAARRGSAEDFAAMIVDSFDEMLDQAQAQPLVMGIALHPYIVGQPFRLRHLRAAIAHMLARRDDVWFTHAGAISRFCHAQPDLFPG
ncbi:polysaccharide deacetylase [Defluviimonas sp. 20V17]|uniref:Chitooligosaccharide deacetylase n=1 Tax=Allgaiera indica TaxID=765699 RepID=A0AAN5A0S6_9RHOB|nr:polysaccharide deacetylase family protein [Allgaiera indica]KDB05296.1 polysaccharide deacetylase [Defluviimonas sp. 20V17]GHE04824.1 polysaccharide deacetylase [Allgaiera indica]SDX53475.1 Polysaccharide deacetylase [Allgaiera indica]